MSQRVNEKQSPKACITARQKVQAPEISELSPDDDVGIRSDATGKPPVAPPPPPPVP